MQRNNLEMYDLRAEEWWKPNGIFSPLKEFNPPRFAYFDQFVTAWDGLRILDVGCGGGYTCEFLAQRGAQVSGLDRSAKALESAQDHAQSQGLSIDYRQGTAESLPYQAGEFDAVVCVDVLEHVSDLPQVVAEIYRVLKPGGIFLFDTINRTLKSKLMMIWFLEYLAGEIPKGTHDWNMFIKPADLNALMADTGFSEIEMQGFDIQGKDKATGKFKIEVNDNKSVMYIGTAKKS